MGYLFEDKLRARAQSFIAALKSAGISGVTNPGAAADTGAILGNQLDDRANRGVSDFDRTHRFVLSYVWDLARPRFADRFAFWRPLLSDWQVSGVITAMTSSGPINRFSASTSGL